jgi:hypothetical protein
MSTKTKTKATPATKEKKTVTAEIVTAVITEKATAKRGRPVVGTSVRQAKIAARDARIAAGGSVERGRPANPDSKRQARLSAQAARAAAGVAIKPGRPKGAGTKPETAAVVA